ncbi:MAG: hypothetical protein QE263_06920 [Vampirovibrionales bacterium]|nr:hypothetical protein [Vampirovibrionales bacterium]
MKLQASPAMAFSAIRRPQQVASPSIAAHDSVRFGSATIKLATVTAAEIAAIKANFSGRIFSAIHELGHAFGHLFDGNTIKKIQLHDTGKKIDSLSKVGYILTEGAVIELEKEPAIAISSVNAFKNSLHKKSLTLASGPVLTNYIHSLSNNKFSIEQLLKKEVTPYQFLKYAGGETDHSKLVFFNHLLNNRISLPKDRFGTKIQKFFKRFFSNIRAWINPHKEHATIIQWIRQSHELMKTVPEEGLFRLAKTLEQHGTIEGHDTIERLVKEALGKDYDTLQKQFNTLVAS